MKFVLICALIAAPLALADEASKGAKVEQLLTIMNVEKQQKVMMDQMSQMVIGQVRAQMAQQGNVPPAEVAKLEDRQKKLFALIQQETSWDKMKPIYIKSYADTFTEPEIDGILAFYKSPAGKAMVDKQPDLNTKIMTSLQSQMADLMPKIEQLMKP
jgi:hypothetical protein